MFVIVRAHVCLNIASSNQFLASKGKTLTGQTAHIHPRMRGLTQWAAGWDELPRAHVQWVTSRLECFHLKGLVYFLFTRCHKLQNVASLHRTVALKWLLWQTAPWLTDCLHGLDLWLPLYYLRRSCKHWFWVMKGSQTHQLYVILSHTVALLLNHLAHLHVRVNLFQQYLVATPNKAGSPWGWWMQQHQWFRVIEKRMWGRSVAVCGCESSQTARTFFKVSKWQHWWLNTICSSSDWASATQ